jgi:alpha-amylase
VGVLDVPESQTVSWADIERSTHSWIGNDMQWAFYSEVRDVEGLVKETDDEELMRLWRYFQISDHLYYMFTSGGGPGAVHSYFSPYEKPIDAFINAQVAFMDFEQRLRLNAFAANEPFRFQTADGDEGYIGLSSLSLLGFYSCLSKVPLRSIEFHQSRGDFEVWIEKSLRDAELADKVRQVSASGEELRLKLKRAVWSRIDQLRNNFRKMGYS